MAHSIITSFLDLCFPQQCITCGHYNTVLCAQCIVQHLDIEQLTIPYDICINALGNIYHTQSLSSGLPIHLTTLGWYTDPFWQRVIESLKFKGMQSIASTLGQTVGPLLTYTGKPSDTILVPVPIHTKRMRERGYNQAALLADAFASQFGALSMDTLLMKTCSTPSQTRLDDDERMQNVEDAFTINSSFAEIDFTQMNIVLVDDVFTTGATLFSAASALMALSPVSIHFLTIVRGR